MKNSELNFSCFDYNSPNTIMRLKIADHYYHPEAGKNTSTDIETVLRESNLLINYEKFPLNTMTLDRVSKNNKNKVKRSLSENPQKPMKHHALFKNVDAQRYSTGDYLRQQIVEDLNSPDILYKSDEQIAVDRYNRVKAYLDQCRSYHCHPSDDNDSDIPAEIRRGYFDNKRRRHDYSTRRANSDLTMFERKKFYRRHEFPMKYSTRNFDSTPVALSKKQNFGIHESPTESRDDEESTDNDAMKNHGLRYADEYVARVTIRRRYSENQGKNRRNYGCRRTRSDLLMRLSTSMSVDDHSDVRTERNSNDQRIKISGSESCYPRTDGDFDGFRGNWMKKSDDDIGQNVSKSQSCEEEDVGQSTETETILQENYLLPEEHVKEYVPSEVLMESIIPRGQEDFSGKLRMLNDHDNCLDNFEEDWMNNKDEEVCSEPASKDIAGDYFRRVYDVLKCCQDRNRVVDKSCDPVGSDDNSSSSNFEADRVRRRRRRRKKKRSVRRRSSRGKIGFTIDWRLLK
uniref:Uncharacterized protein n=1 Tax=Bracon brevicornis TaxID=1563983 RepID=A0A6V7J8J5_9HYME